MKHSSGIPIVLAISLILLCNGAMAAAAPTFTSVPAISGMLRVGSVVTVSVAASDPQGLPFTTTYNYGTGTSDTLGKHIYLAAGIYPVTVTLSNGSTSATMSRQVAIQGVANLWILRQTVRADSMGSHNWQAKYIYNADRTAANIFNPATEDFAVSLGGIPGIQISENGIQKFSGSKPRFFFHSAPGAKPSLTILLSESSQTITVGAKSETFAGALPGDFQNSVQVGTSIFSLDQSFDASGTFAATSGYRSAAFVVSGASIKVGQPGKDSVALAMYMGDPAFVFPGASGSKTVRVRMTNVLNQVVFDKDLTASVTSSAGVLKAPSGAFKYDSSKGSMSFKLSHATLAGLLVTSEEYVRVDVTIGDLTYTTRVTLFTPGCRKPITYTTNMPKKYCNFTPGRIADTTPPTIVSTIPVDSATGVAINIKPSATFSEAMDPMTIDASTFSLTQGNSAVAGTVSYSTNGAIATFTPASNLLASTPYTATITTGAKDLAGNALVANVVWNFTTGATADTTPPSVVSTNPADLATNVPINQSINATFSEAMDPATINTANFILAGPGSNLVTGQLTYDTANQIATLTPTTDLATGTQYTATITTGVKDLAGNALTANKVWNFTTGSQRALTPVPLGAAASFGTFGGGAGMTNQGIFTVVNGDISTTGASTTVTGFHDSTGDIYSETPLNKGQVNGRIYTAPPTPGGAGVGGNASTFAIATQGVRRAESVQRSSAGVDPGRHRPWRPSQLGGLTLAPGVYQAAGGTFQITGSDLTLHAKGDSNAVWVFQMASSLTVGSPGAPRSIILSNGAQAKNIFWQVGSAATINAAGGGTMVGTILASSGVTFSTSGNVTLVTLNGRAIGLNASTTLVNTVINVPAP